MSSRRSSRSYNLVLVLVTAVCLLSLAEGRLSDARLHCGAEGRLDHPDVVKGHFMVRMKEQIDTHKLYKSLRGSLKEGYKVQSIYHHSQTLHLSMASNDTIEKLLKNPDVALIECDRVISINKYSTSLADHFTPLVLNETTNRKRATLGHAPSWGLDRANQRALPLDDQWNYVSHTGKGVHIFIADTGIDYSHPEFQGRLSDGYNVIKRWKKGQPDWNDGNGHGSHCAGVAAGATFGLAPEATLHAVRVLNDRGMGTISGLLQGLDWIRSYHFAHDYPSVVSLSLGVDLSPIINEAVEAAMETGISFSVAAGNDGANACYTSPASANGVVAVSATDIEDTAPVWANYGPCVDIYAPGVSITSAWKGGRVATISGTSMACPHVTGSIALYLQKNPDSTPAEVKKHLMDYTTSSVPSNRAGTRFLYIGEGYITNSVPATHVASSAPAQECTLSGSPCSRHDECCTGRCWNFNKSCR